MSHESNDKLLDETIRRAVGREMATFDAAAWMATHREELAMLESRKSTPAAATHRGRPFWRTIMNARRTLKIAASAAAVVAIAVTAVMWPVTGGRSTIALAAVLEQLQIKSYEFALDYRFIEGEDDPITMTMKGMVLEPGKCRIEQPDAGLGPTVSIFNHDTQHTLLLMERYKSAHRFGKPEKEEEEPNVLEFLTQPNQSISDLWNLQTGTETQLDPKEIDGRAVQGFRVTQTIDEYTGTITVWADAKTAAPVQVEITLQPNTDGEHNYALELTLRDFKVVANLDPALFNTTEIPEGYTLANHLTLEQLMAESATDTPANENTSAEAEKMLTVLKLWRGDNKQQAVEMLAAIDWEADFRFSREQHVFTMTERQYISLVMDEQIKVMDEIMSQLDAWRGIARELFSQADQARDAGNNAEAEAHLHAAVKLGQFLYDKNRLVLVQMVGITIEYRSQQNLSSLYEALGETDRLQGVQQRMAELEQIRARHREAPTGEQ